MDNLLLTERIVTNKDWATLLFFVGFSIIAINRTIFSIRFSEFTRLAISDKYIKIYKDNTNLRNSFTLSFLAIQLLSITFFFQIVARSFGFIEQYSLLSFVQILNFTCFFVIGKYLIDKIIGITFGIEDFVDNFNLQKATYRNYIGMYLLVLDLLLFYNDIVNQMAIGLFGITLILTNLSLYVIFIKNHRKTILNKLFYFILYLCTLEIAPYFIIYFAFKNFRA